jgi:hypothetical protein
LLGAALALLPGCTGTDTAEGLNTGASTPACTAPAISDALSRARPGGTVQLGKCTVTGSFTVPAGVILAGAGAGQTVITAPAKQPAIVLKPGSTPSAVKDLGIKSAGTAGVLAQGTGTGKARVEGITVTATLGIGLGAEKLESFEMQKVTVTGPVTRSTKGSFSIASTPDKAATHGIVLWGVGAADLAEVTASGWTGYGALFIKSGTRWTGGAASDNLGVGVMIVDGQATLDGVTLSGTFQDKSGFPGFGGVFASAPLVTGTPDETAAGAAVTLINGTVHGNEGPGLLYGGGQSLEVESTEVDGNQFAGLLVAQSSGITVRSSTFGQTKTVALATSEPAGEIEGGDGVQLLGSTQGIHFDDVQINTNSRGGLLVDIGDVELAQADMTWSNVSVSGNAVFGALCQGSNANGQKAVWGPGYGTTPWDEGILRDDISMASDTQIVSPVDILGVVDPNVMPSPVSVVTGGLIALTAR